MLGPIARKYMFKGYAIGIWLGDIPYQWDSKEKLRVKSSSSKIRKSRCYEHIIYTVFAILWFGFQAWRLDRKVEESKENLLFSVLALILAVACVFPLCLYINYFRAGPELVSYAYDFIEYGTRFQEKYLTPEELVRQSSQKHDTSGAFLVSLFYLELVIFNIPALLCALIPEMPFLLTGMFEFSQHIYYSVAVLQVFAAVGFFNTVWVVNQSIYAFPAIESLFSMKYILSEIKLGAKMYTTLDKLRDTREFIVNYRCLQILMAKAAYIYSPLVIPANEWTYVTIITYSIYSAITMDGIISFFTASCAFLSVYYIVITFTIGAEIRQSSQEVLERWRLRSHNRWAKRTIKSLRPISIPVGGCYFVDYSMLLTMYKSMIEGTVNLLILG